MGSKRAVIVGAGMAGLTTGLSLARYGIACDIFEQAAELTQVGAGLQLSPNASRILDVLGLTDALSAEWIEPSAIRLLSGTSLAVRAVVPSGSFARRRWNAPYAVMHRAALQKALLDAIAAEPLCRLHLAIEVGSAALPPQAETADVIIGADGVWSKISKRIPGSLPPRFSGNIAYRLTVSSDDVPEFLGTREVSAFLGPGAHLVSYPLGGSHGVNVVAITGGNSAIPDWKNDLLQGRRAEMLSAFSRWNAGLTTLLERDNKITFWPLYQKPAGPWHDGRKTVVIGDAAHAMMPFAAQGAAMAIEDGFELAGFLAAYPVSEALPLFERHRAPRVARIAKRASFNKFAYHARGPIAFGRDLVLSRRSPESLAADLDWIYGYDAFEPSHAHKKRIS